MTRRIPKDADALNVIYKATSGVLDNYPDCARFPHMAQKIAESVARALGLICQDCTEPTRARGYCWKHYQRRFRRIVAGKETDALRR